MSSLTGATGSVSLTGTTNLTGATTFRLNGIQISSNVASLTQFQAEAEREFQEMTQRTGKSENLKKNNIVFLQRTRSFDDGSIDSDEDDELDSYVQTINTKGWSPAEAELLTKLHRQEEALTLEFNTRRQAAKQKREQERKSQAQQTQTKRATPTVGQAQQAPQPQQQARHAPQTTVVSGQSQQAPQPQKTTTISSAV